MVDRRGFLALLGLGGAGLAIAPGAVLSAPEPLVVEAGSTLMTPAWIMKEVARAFKDHLGGYRTKYVPAEGMGARLGDVVEGHRMNTQRFQGSEWALFEGPRLLRGGVDLLERMRAEHCRPIGQSLAEAVRKHNIRAMSDLALPNDGAKGARVSSKSDGFSLRGVWQYDVSLDRELFRVDLIGAAA